MSETAIIAIAANVLAWVFAAGACWAKLNGLERALGRAFDQQGKAGDKLQELERRVALIERECQRREARREL